MVASASRKVVADVKIGKGGRPGTVRVVVELPEDLGNMLDQLATIEKVPKKTTIGKALKDLREEIREKGIGVLFEDDNESSQQ